MVAMINSDRRRGQRALLVVLAALSLILGACGDGDDDAAAAGIVDGDLDAVCAQGAEEGSFTYWATFEPDNFARILEPFQATYPGIEVEFLPQRPQESVQGMLTSAAAGQEVTPDLVNGNLDALLPLNDRDLVDLDVDWSAIGVPDDLIHESNMVRLYRVPNGLAYNTDITSPDDLPDTWEELIDAQYNQDVVVDPRGNPFTILSLFWGEEETIDYAQRLVDIVDPVVIQGGTAGMLAVVSGDVLTTTGGRADSNAELQADGAPVDIKYLDVVPTQDFYNLLVAGSTSPNAAACFAGWLTTAEGQAVHEEVEFKSNESIPPNAPEGATIVSIESPEDAEAAASVAESLQDLFGFEG